MSELVHYGAGDQVVTRTPDSPHNRNALSRQLVAELSGRLAQAVADPSARAIVITTPAGCSAPAPTWPRPTNPPRRADANFQMSGSWADSVDLRMP